MGHTSIIVGAVALGAALICLFLGHRWGSSNVRSQVEGALDMARVSADAREYALREQLDERMLELSQLRARADEVSLLQEQLQRLQATSMRTSSGPSVPAEPNDRVSPVEQRSVAPEPISGEKAMLSFLGLKPAKPRQPNETQDALAEDNRLPVTKFPVKSPHNFAPENTMPEQPKPPAIRPAAAINPPAVRPAVANNPAAARPAVAINPPAARPNPASKPPAARSVHTVNNDDWDEFAKSLAALKQQK